MKFTVTQPGWDPEDIEADSAQEAAETYVRNYGDEASQDWTLGDYDWPALVRVDDVVYEVWRTDQPVPREHLTASAQAELGDAPVTAVWYYARLASDKW